MTKKQFYRRFGSVETSNGQYFMIDFSKLESIFYGKKTKVLTVQISGVRIELKMSTAKVGLDAYKLLLDHYKTYHLKK